MKILVNSEPHEITGPSLAAALMELGYTSPAIATALNGQFVARDARAAQPLHPGDRIEVLAPMQGG
ncbi:sulfur carrier protein ThiS [Lyngbya sp. CCY1209]|jgi:sulfur carrier protein|uniref:sulfur carrier protein ThiS n=1 Tax=Epibacterium sp. MM17-32 TaxID=2917734 RepID=UPI001EF4FB63|nr:sulfur carrier protein ThiS [Epibacterium sp. MM17-32]MCG7630193.1 sulfur carrier protein ThiS [Epibacterium sp. MM17-32]MEB3887228.1 sulfur carrier protein ThiS [Lyngbya sp. CCY1209]